MYQVLEEVKKPEGDKNRIFRRAAKTSMIVAIVLYILVLVAYVSTSNGRERVGSSDESLVFGVLEG
jgi:amino acid transporter